MNGIIDSSNKLRIESLIIGTFGSLLAASILYLFKKISIWILIIVTAIIILASLLYVIIFTIRAIGFSRLWLPSSRYHLNYKILDARNEYIAVGVTLGSMLQTTGVGFDIEKYAEKMPRTLSVKLLILHPDSPFFAERVLEAHSSRLSPDEIIESKRTEQLEMIKKVRRCLDQNVEIRFYNTYPAWWIQVVDHDKIYFATQTRSSHIGQTYPFGILLVKKYDSELFNTISILVKNLWCHSLCLRPDGSIPKLS